MSYLYTANTEFNERTKHLTTRDLICSSANSAFDKQTVIMRLKSRRSDGLSQKHVHTYRNLCSCESRACIESNAVAPGASIDFNFSSIGLETLGGVLGRDTALNCKTAFCDGFLSKA